LIVDTVELRNYVIVGGKPTMNYVVACLTLFNEGAFSVTLRALGRNIASAVDTVEMLRRIFLRDACIESISIGTDARERPKANVSTIEIVITPK